MDGGIACGRVGAKSDGSEAAARGICGVADAAPRLAPLDALLPEGAAVIDDGVCNGV